MPLHSPRVESFSGVQAHDANESIERRGASDLIRITGVSKSFGVHSALADIDLHIRSGEFLILLGPSGCGKTTLLRLIGGFDHPTSGQIDLDGKDLLPLPPHRRPINTVFQSYALFPHLTVRQNIAFGLRMLRRSTESIDKRVSEVLRLVRLDGLDERKPSQLSGGQQQRVALARALAPSPRLLLLDEPLSALDLKLRKEMQIELKRLQRETGITFVLVTHDQEEALAMADRVAVLNAGNLLQVGHPEEVYAKPHNKFVADFIGEANIVDGARFGRRGASMSLRPECISIGAPTEKSRMLGTIVGTSFLGSDMLYQVKVEPDNAEIRVRAREVTTRRLAIGSEVGLNWPETSEWWMQQ
ncbi:MAG: ABC transporter ATP-binding protein [Devosia sp.]